MLVVGGVNMFSLVLIEAMYFIVKKAKKKFGKKNQTCSSPKLPYFSLTFQLCKYLKLGIDI